MASTQPTTQRANFDICATGSRKISWKTFHRKTYFTQFHDFLYNLLSKIFVGLLAAPLEISFSPSESFLLLKLAPWATALVVYSKTNLHKSDIFKWVGSLPGDDSLLFLIGEFIYFWVLQIYMPFHFIARIQATNNKNNNNNDNNNNTRFFLLATKSLRAQVQKRIKN